MVRRGWTTNFTTSATMISCAILFIVGGISYFFIEDEGNPYQLGFLSVIVPCLCIIGFFYSRDFMGKIFTLDMNEIRRRFPRISQVKDTNTVRENNELSETVFYEMVSDLEKKGMVEARSKRWSRISMRELNVKIGFTSGGSSYRTDLDKVYLNITIINKKFSQRSDPDEFLLVSKMIEDYLS